MSDSPEDRHRAGAPEVLASGDPAAIKRLYVDLGDDMWEAHSGRPDEVPVFSYAGTHVVVADALGQVDGLVLDAGCGPNPALSIALSKQANKAVVALDIGLGTVRSAVAVAEAAGVSPLGVVGDVEALPFRTDAFDAVACDDTIEHLPNDATGAAELERVARLGSVVVIATPNRRSLKIIGQKLKDRLRGHRRPASDYYVSNSHIREYTWSECQKLVKPVLTVTRRRGVPFEGGQTRPLIVKVVNGLVTRRPFHRLSPMIVLVATPANTHERRG